MSIRLMRAALLRKPGLIETLPLSVENVPIPEAGPQDVLLRVLACGVCRTDLHIAEGELPQLVSGIIPGHQIVAEVVSSPDSRFKAGDRVGVSWLGGVDENCRFCLRGNENLCDHPVFTGYSKHGGFAEYVLASPRFLLPVPCSIAATYVAPLLCAGIIGYRSLRVAEVRPGQRVGLFGFGSSAQLLMKVLVSWGCDVYVSTREEGHRMKAEAMGALWTGDGQTPALLDAAITFAPSGQVVLSALKSLDKGGILAINAIHLDQMPSFDYDSVLWGERQIRSVTNMTRQDAIEFLHLAARLQIVPDIQIFHLEDINVALAALKTDGIHGSAVVLL